MDSHYPLSAKRLYALMGDRMIDFPPYFIERLERRLEAFETSRTNEHRVMHLRVVPDAAADAPKEDSGCRREPQRTADVAVPIRTLQALASIFEVLHSVHVGRQQGQPDNGFGEYLVERLIITGRELVRSSADAMWSGS
ncbi:hypothetical protein [Stenotrophomonas sp. CFBP8980]|uniref:hypothetical protein n=1 Tax=Stenotrophomonas sp. CFBP8980 TaxID=3096523 RepID=UPI002A6B0E2C|nr:hypothetical protein [Stenotrophomonas sp. CFBP8980]MDY1033624.1 hypothetical protein [Stenotrophomonas sp. CFBP8980]